MKFKNLNYIPDQAVSTVAQKCHIENQLLFAY